jgi:hypothetical protein
MAERKLSGYAHRHGRFGQAHAAGGTGQIGDQAFDPGNMVLIQPSLKIGKRKAFTLHSGTTLSIVETNVRRRP